MNYTLTILKLRLKSTRLQKISPYIFKIEETKHTIKFLKTKVKI